MGDIGLHFYDINGVMLHSELEERLIGASKAVFDRIGRVVGVAGGNDKFKSILGAVRGRLINTLVTDVYTAQRLLDAPRLLDAAD